MNSINPPAIPFSCAVLEKNMDPKITITATLTAGMMPGKGFFIFNVDSRVAVSPFGADFIMVKSSFHTAHEKINPNAISHTREPLNNANPLKIPVNIF